ncbi:MAG: SagB/ThcOx family dehydrogenase [Desulfuromonadales bacterium]
MANRELSRHRAFLKDTLRLQIDFSQTDQNRGIEPPPLQKPPRQDQVPLPLAGREAFEALRGTDLVDAIGLRRSRRRFVDQPLSLTELSWLLWATQGITEILAPGCALRTVPSAGCRHAFETYLLASNIETLDTGVYRYLPVEHALVFEYAADNLPAALARATFGQAFIAAAPVTLAWTVIPYRMEWRYDIAAHRVIAMDVGHLCQNLYLACAAIGAGTCAIAAYHQQQMDALLKVDGENEFTIYLAPVGKIPA